MLEQIPLNNFKEKSVMVKNIIDNFINKEVAENVDIKLNLQSPVHETRVFPEP